MMDPNVLISLVGVLILGSLWIQFALNRRQRRKDRLEDDARYEMERLVNERHRNLVTSDDLKVAQELVASNAVTADTLKASTEKTEKTLGQIHDAVNSNLTKAQDRIAALEREVRLLLENLRERDQKNNVDPEV